MLKAWARSDTAGRVTARASHTPSSVKVSRPCLASGTRILTLGGLVVYTYFL